MELKNVSPQLGQINSKNGVGNDLTVNAPASKGQQGTEVSNGPSFESTLQALQQNGLSGVGQNPQAVKVPSDVKFSNHAVERMISRGISFKPEQMAKLNDAIGRAAAKGSKDSLILMDDAALIVSVKNKTVVTVMDKQALKENVFTNIDSTIVM